MYELSMDKGWLLYSWAITSDPVNRFSGLKMSKSPMSQEADKLLIQLKNHLKQQSQS